MGEQYTGFFHNYVSPTIILMSAALFSALMLIQFNRISSHSFLSWLIQWVSHNTIAIYLIHMIIIVTLSSRPVLDYG
ncbi:MAG: hypothetical protein WDA42_09905 [Candidatus Bathyarchaeia archaeon]